MIKSFLISATALALSATAAQAVVTVTVEAPGVTITTELLANSGIETFSDAPLGGHTLTTTFGGTPVTGAYTTFNINAGDQYGGVGGSNYFVTFNAVTIALTGPNVHYFGLFVDAIDAGNSIAFFKGTTLLYTSSIAAAASLASAYSGNPSGPFAGADSGEKFAFFNFDIDGTGYDKVVLTQTQGGGFETDNHTIGNFDVAAVPEPATWALMVIGFGMLGVSARRRKRILVS